jgi:hypothetical protein
MKTKIVLVLYIMKIKIYTVHLYLYFPGAKYLKTIYRHVDLSIVVFREVVSKKAGDIFIYNLLAGS